MVFLLSSRTICVNAGTASATSFSTPTLAKLLANLSSEYWQDLELCEVKVVSLPALIDTTSTGNFMTLNHASHPNDDVVKLLQFLFTKVF